MTDSPKFTLEQLAHFNRCLFPGNFEEDLIESGCDTGTARMLANYLRRHRDGGILGIYQEFITDDYITRKINDFIEKFVERHP